MTASREGGRGIPCKIGTVPKVIFAVDRRNRMEVGRTVRVKERRGSKWQPIFITRVDDDGYFMGDYL